jgi:hypothetical protein
MRVRLWLSRQAITVLTNRRVPTGVVTGEWPNHHSYRMHHAVQQSIGDRRAEHTLCPRLLASRCLDRRRTG